MTGSHRSRRVGSVPAFPLRLFSWMSLFGQPPQRQLHPARPSSLRPQASTRRPLPASSTQYTSRQCHRSISEVERTEKKHSYDAGAPLSTSLVHLDATCLECEVAVLESARLSLSLAICLYSTGSYILILLLLHCPLGSLLVRTASHTRYAPHNPLSRRLGGGVYPPNLRC